MANNNIIIDVESGLMARDFFSTFPSDAKTFVYGDTVELSITAVKRNTGIDAAERPWVLLDMTDKTFHVATGSTDRLPIAGEWGLLTSAAMDYNATASEVEVVLNAETTISAEGGLDVTALSDGGWRLTYKTTGAKTALSVGINTMLPTSGVYISEQRAGDATNKAVVLVTLETQANSYLEMADDIPAPTVTIEQVRNGDVAQELSEVQRVHMTGEAISGTYAITLDGVATGEIAFDADAIDITTAIAALPIIAGDESLVSVTGDSRDFTVTFDSSLGDLSNLVVDYSNLNGLNGKTGALNLNTVETLELLNGGKNASALLEILWYNTAQSNGETIHQSTVTIVQDVIPSTPPSVTGNHQYANLIHTHAISEVSNLQTELDDKADTSHTHTISEVTNLQTELDDLQSQLDGAAANVVVSDSAPSSPVDGDLWFDSELAQMFIYYNDGDSSQWVTVSSLAASLLGHTHAISDVTNLQAELDGKSPAGSVVYHAASTAPTGWLEANGALISRAVYSDLYSAIGDTYGAGDGSTTFALPDLRGEFLRGFDNGRGIDTGRTFGDSQADQLKSHSHGSAQYHTPSGPIGYGGVGGNMGISQGTSTTGGTETRPRNIALLAIIKY